LPAKRSLSILRLAGKASIRRRPVTSTLGSARNPHNIIQFVMQTLKVIIYVALGICLAGFVFTHWNRSRKLPPSDQGSRGSKVAHSASPPVAHINAAALLQRVVDLKKKGAQWTEIFSILNPHNNPRIHELLIDIRGPHMFDPNTALGVIETGCRDVNGQADAITALEAAHRSMNRVLKAGN
jgi:hypothetical protein